ncbi:MAG: PspC domain-containing protein [Candidatus Saccharimonadales bacterium]
MDFSRNTTSQPAARPAGVGTGKSNAWKGSPTWLRVIWVILLFAGTALIVAVLALLYSGGDKQSKLIDKTKFQAVFLTDGQVYFGNLVNVNSEYMDLKNIYYLSVGQPVQPKEGEKEGDTTITLQKLGCELHGPVDQMVVNKDQVKFWENLKTDGLVSQKIDEWVAQNPEGLKCNTNPQSSLELDAALRNS